MKGNICAFLLLAAAAAHAAAPKVEITSFVYAGSHTRAAELCGKATGTGAPVVVRVTVDPQAKKPGVYNVMADKDGLFCAVVVTYTGTAEASAWVGEKIGSPQATAISADERP